MKKDLKNIDTQAKDLIHNSQKIADITETVLDALAYCSENTKNTSHIVSVVELLKRQINMFLEEVDTHEQDILRINLQTRNKSSIL